MFIRIPNHSALAMAFALIGTASITYARTWQEGLEGSVERLGAEMGYRVFLPDGYDASQEYPLVLFLHGSGESGTDNTRQVSRNISSLISKTESEFPAILVAPQLPASNGWAVVNQTDLTTEVLDEVLSDYAVDRDRLYLTGLSMGGFGTMHYLHLFNAINPDLLRFAAAAPVAGSFIDESLAPALQETPIWLAHGDRDNAVDVAFSRETFNVLAGEERGALIDFPEGSLGAGGPMAVSGLTRYTEYPGAGHNTWSRFYASQDVYEWMFAQSLTTVPEPSSALLLLIASPLASGLARRLRRG
ncbi:Putative esterase [Planctomycetes bacterium MalM25]|nr:Putative esterase [Planctomycetes bacterium MalM25]